MKKVPTEGAHQAELKYDIQQTLATAMSVYTSQDMFAHYHDSIKMLQDCESIDTNFHPEVHKETPEHLIQRRKKKYMGVIVTNVETEWKQKCQVLSTKFTQEI